MADAPSTSTYLLVSNDSVNLPNSQVLTASDGLQFTSSGPGGGYNIAPVQALLSLANLSVASSTGLMTFNSSTQLLGTTSLTSDSTISISSANGSDGPPLLRVNPNTTSQLISASGNGGSSIGSYPLINFSGIEGTSVSVTANGAESRIDVEISASGVGTVTAVGLDSPNNTIDISGSASPITSAGTFDIDLVPTGVVAGSYTNLNGTVDIYGRLTTASNGIGGDTGISARTLYANFGVDSLQSVINQAYSLATSNPYTVIASPGTFTDGGTLTVTGLTGNTSVTLQGNTAVIGAPTTAVSSSFSGNLVVSPNPRITFNMNNFSISGTTSFACGAANYFKDCALFGAVSFINPATGSGSYTFVNCRFATSITVDAAFTGSINFINCDFFGIGLGGINLNQSSASQIQLTGGTNIDSAWYSANCQMLGIGRSVSSTNLRLNTSSSLALNSTLAMSLTSPAAINLTSTLDTIALNAAAPVRCSNGLTLFNGFVNQYSFPNTAGTSGQVIGWPVGAGSQLTWQSPPAGSSYAFVRFGALTAAASSTQLLTIAGAGAIVGFTATTSGTDIVVGNTGVYQIIYTDNVNSATPGIGGVLDILVNGIAPSLALNLAVQPIASVQQLSISAITPLTIGDIITVQVTNESLAGTISYNNPFISIVRIA